jgi:ketosteroid isomerase-like protein
MAADVVREVYKRFGEADVEGFLKLCADNIEWVVNGPSTLEKCRSFNGIDGVRAFLSILDRSWSFTSFAPREFIDGGDKVVVLGEEAGTDRVTGEAFENRWAHVFTLRGHVIVTFREFLCHWRGSQHPPDMSWQ